MADKASTYDYERAEHTSVTVRSKEEEDSEWRPYVGPEGGTGWTDGEQINYDDSFAPDPANIDEEATEQFLQQVPEDERADARDELGIPENGREAEDDTPSDLLSVDEVAQQLEAAEDGPLEVNPDGDDPKDVAIDLVTEGEASPETVAEAVDQTGVDDVTHRLVMKEVTGEIDGIDAEMTLMSSYPFNREFTTERYTEEEEVVNRTASRGWIRSMFNEDTVPVFKVAEEQTGNSELGGGADKPTEVIERTELEPVEDEPNLPEDREFYEGQEVELLNEDTTGVVEHIHGSEVEIRTGESYLDQEVDADTLEAMRGISEKTTEAFRDAFGETVTVYRGYAEDGHNATNAESTDVSQQMVDAKEAGEPIEHDHRTAEAWSTNPQYASSYAKKGRSGAMLAREVPVEQIIMASHTTNLQRAESEIVVAHDENEQYSPDQILTQEQLQSAESGQLILEQVLESIEDRPEMVKIDKSPRQIGLKPDPQWIHRDDISVNTSNAEGSTRNSSGSPVYRTETPDGVPDDYEYIPPDKKPPDSHAVVESNHGGRYISPEPVNDTDNTELSSGVQEAISRLEELAGQIKRGERFAEAKFEMQSVVEEQTGVDSVSFRTRPANIEKSARCGKEVLRLSDSEDVSGLDEFRVDPNDDDLKGLRGVASGRYKIRDSKIVINPDQFDEDVVQEWAENGHWVGSEPESIVTHEIAHHLHAENTAPLDVDADVNWNATKGELDDSVEELIGEEISDYAATMIGEFIAEAYVLQKEGGTLPETLRDLYEQYNGPEVA